MMSVTRISRPACCRSTVGPVVLAGGGEGTDGQRRHVTQRGGNLVRQCEAKENRLPCRNQHLKWQDRNCRGIWAEVAGDEARYLLRHRRKAMPANREDGNQGNKLSIGMTRTRRRNRPRTAYPLHHSSSNVKKGKLSVIRLPRFGSLGPGHNPSRLRVALQPQQLRTHLRSVLDNEASRSFSRAPVQDIFEPGRQIGIETHRAKRVPAPELR